MSATRTVRFEGLDVPVRKRIPFEQATRMYRDEILKVTGCKKQDVGEIEELMRNTYHSLSGLITREFNKEARLCYKAYKLMEAEGWFK